MRKIYYFLGIIGVIAAVAAAGYFLRYRAAAPQETPAAPGGGLPQTPAQSIPAQGGQGAGGAGAQAQPYAGQKFGIVAQNQAVEFFLDPQNNLFIVQPNGQIVEMSGGDQVVLSSSEVANLASASFSYDGKKILEIFGTGPDAQASVFDVAGKSWKPLPQGTRSPAWSPVNYKIAYITDKGNSQAINTLDTSVANAKPVEIARLEAQDVVLNWLNPNTMMISERSSAFSAGSIWSFDIKNKTFGLVALDRPGLVSLWSGAAGEGLLFSASSVGRGGILRLVNAKGTSLESLSFLTLPSKCAFNVVSSTPASVATTTKTGGAAGASLQKTLYCAIPRDAQGFAKSILPDDYQKKSFFTSDDFYSINLTSGDTNPLFSDQGQNIDADDLKVFNNALFFINRFDQKIYAISLK